MTRLIGYARVSTYDQNLNLQIDALKKAGCSDKLIFVDKVSGIKTERVGLNSALNILTKGDTLIVWGTVKLSKYNYQRFHSSIGYKKPMNVYLDSIQYHTQMAA